MIFRRRLRTSIEIEASCADVWSLLAEFRHWPEWGPTVRAVVVDADHVAAGVTGRVQTVVGAWLPFEITDVEAGRSWFWRVAGIEATGHIVTPVGSGRSEVTFTVPIGFAPYVVVLRAGLRKVKALAEGSGEPG